MPSVLEWDEHGGRLNWKPRPVDMNSFGAHFWILQTDSSRMAVAICTKCHASLTDEKVNHIFADIIFTKLSQIKGHTEKDYKLFDRIRTLEVWKWFYSERLLADYLEGTKIAEEHSAGGSEQTSGAEKAH